MPALTIQQPTQNHVQKRQSDGNGSTSYKYLRSLTATKHYLWNNVLQKPCDTSVHWCVFLSLSLAIFMCLCACPCLYSLAGSNSRSYSSSLWVDQNKVQQITTQEVLRTRDQNVGEGEEKEEQSVSTYDILVSHFGRNVNCDLLIQPLDYRGRSNDMSDVGAVLRAGNRQGSILCCDQGSILYDRKSCTC